MSLKHIYTSRDDFFKNCVSVARAPGSFFWTGEHSVMYGQPAIIQPINLHAWVGLEFNNLNRFEFEVATVEWKLFSIEREIRGSDMKLAEDRGWRQHNSIGNFLVGWKERNNFKKYFKVKIWCEIPPSVGLNSSGAISACLSLLLHMLENKLGIEEINETLQNWRKSEVIRLREDEVFDNVFRKAWLFDDCFHNFSSSGMGPFSSLINNREGQELLLYLTEEKGYGSKHSIMRSQVEYDSHLESLKGISFIGERIKVHQNFRRDIRLLIFYSGYLKATQEMLEKLDRWHKLSLGDIATKLSSMLPEKTFRDLLIADPLREFLSRKKVKTDPDRYPRRLFMQSLGMISWKMLGYILKGDIQSFLQTVHENHIFLDFYGVSSPELERLRTKIQNASDKVEAKLTGAGGGGDLVVFGDWKDTKELCDRIEGFRAKGKFEYGLHYDSETCGWLVNPIEIIRKPSPVREQKNIKVFLNGKQDYFSESDVNKYLAEKENFAVLLVLPQSKLWSSGNKEKLTPLVKKALIYLCKRFPEVCTYKDLSWNLWQIEMVEENEKSMKDRIQQLFDKNLFPMGKEGKTLRKFIKTVVGEGYKFKDFARTLVVFG